MKQFDLFLEKYWKYVSSILLVVIFFNTCGNPNRITNKRLDSLTTRIDSLEKITVTNKDLMIEGLKAEKRMIQSTDRKMLDVQRQATIDQEIKALEK